MANEGKFSLTSTPADTRRDRRGKFHAPPGWVRCERVQARVTVAGRAWLSGLLAHLASRPRRGRKPPGESEVIWAALGRFARARGYGEPQPPLSPHEPIASS